VKKCVISVLFLTLPALATISNVQSNANWSCASLSGSAVTCTVNTTTHTTLGNLLAVWTFWQPGAFPYTAAVRDSPNSPPNNFVSAVGPTAQSASTFTNAQIFYAANIQPSTGADTITVTFTCPSTVTACGSSPSISQAGVAVVEYSGADQSYPLDSASAGYSTTGNMTNLLDSGTVAPANSNLLVFGAGFADQPLALVASSGFTSHQTSHGTWGTGLVEDNTAAISGNNVLQRATACIGSALGTCPGTTAGNWVMQMAVFRDASWTVAGGWIPPRFAQILDATQFPGVDIGDQVNHAYAALPATGGHIIIPAKADGSCYNFITPIVLSTPGKYVLLEHAGAGGAIVTSTAPVTTAVVGCLNFTVTSGTPTPVAITLDYANNLQTVGAPRSSVHGLRNILLVNNQCATPDGCGGSAVGIQIGTTNQGIQGATMENVSIIGFHIGFQNTNFFSDPVTWINPQIWDNGVGMDIGNVSTTPIFGGFINSNVQGVYADDKCSRSELHFHSTSFVGNSLAFNYINVGGSGSCPHSGDAGPPAFLFLDDVHFENGQSQSAAPHYIEGNVDVFISGGTAENDSHSGNCGNADWFFLPSGNKFIVDGMTFSGGPCVNLTYGIVDAANNTRISLSGFIVNFGLGALTTFVGGTNAAKATVRMSNGDITNPASNWYYESPLYAPSFNSAKFNSGSSNIASSGTQNLAAGDMIAWRNAANSADLLLERVGSGPPANELVWTGGNFGFIGGLGQHWRNQGANSDTDSQCTLSSGTCSLTFTTAFVNAAPVCIATVTTTGTFTTGAALKIATTLTGYTVSSTTSTDTAAINVHCGGNPNGATGRCVATGLHPQRAFTITMLVGPLPPAENGEPGNGDNAPVEFTEKTEIELSTLLATYKNLPLGSSATPKGCWPVAADDAGDKTPLLSRKAATLLFPT
jgi:hypothetical protein